MEQSQFLQDDAGKLRMARVAVGFVYYLPGKPIFKMIETALSSHISRWGCPPAMIRVSRGNVEAARTALDALHFPQVQAVPNGGTLACEVETWEGEYAA